MVYADDLPLDHFRRETTRHGQREFPIQYYVDELFRFENRWVPLHWHPEPELMVARGGNVRVLLGDQEVLLVDGDGILINGNILHLFEQPLPTDRCQNPNIVFSAELIAPVASAAYQNYVKPLIEDEGLPFVVLTRDVPWQKDVLDQLDIVFALLHQYGPEGAYGKLPALPERFRDVVSPCHELAVQGRLGGLWQLLWAHREQLPRFRLDKSQYLARARVQNVLEYLHRHFAEAITIRSIAEAAAISKSEVFRCFSSYLGSSPMGYLLNFRIENAQRLLRSTQWPIKRVCRECGFLSESYFSKRFREKVGAAPREYRHRASAPTA